MCAQSVFPSKNAEHMHQEMMCTLSIRVRNWCIHWTYESGTDAYLEHMHQFLTRMLSISIKILYLKRSLQSMLSKHIRNWCVHWACMSGTDACTEPDAQAQATSPWVKKVGHCNTRGTVRALFFPAQIHCCTIVYIFNILWRLKVKNFMTPTVKKKLSSVLFILTANGHWTYLYIILVTNHGGSHYFCRDVSPVTLYWLCSLFYHLVMNVKLI